MDRSAKQGLLRPQSLLPVLAGLVTVLGLSACAMSERGPDTGGFVSHVRQVLGEAEQREVPVSQLLAARWEQLCTHRQGSLNITLIELDRRHVLRVPYAQLTVGESTSADSLDGQCLRREELVRLRRHGSDAASPIVLERASGSGAVVAQVARQ